MRIVFMGTPGFAVPPLQALLRGGHEVAAVFTQPDKPQGRKMVVTPPPVKVLAGMEGIPVYQPATLKDGAALRRIEQIAPDVIAVAAYGRILPKSILGVPKLGCINVHASLLPKYRGAAPIQAAILNGEPRTGVTTIQMAEGLDTGDILLQMSTPIFPEETAEDLTVRLSNLGADLLMRTLQTAEEGALHPVPQDDGQSSYAPMVTRQMSPVDWNHTALQIHNQVRGLSPWPGASTVFRGRTLKICRSRVAPQTTSGLPGMIFSEQDAFLVVCGEGSVLELLDVQPEGGKKMRGGEFLRGHSAQGVVLPG